MIDKIVKILTIIIIALIIASMVVLICVDLELYRINRTHKQVVWDAPNEQYINVETVEPFSFIGFINFAKNN